jgi:hypothetical protein
MEKPAEPEMLVGAWLMLDDRISFPQGCESSAPIRYYADGRFALFAESGTWKLERRMLTEVATSADRLQPDSEGTTLGKPYVSELTFIDENRFMKRFSDGAVREFRRCPSYERTSIR